MLALLALVPMALLVKVVGAEHTTLLFLLSCAAIVPLASFLGGATEVISVRLGPGLGGLMNATFGNAAEFILALAALRAGETQMVKASLTGSVIGNILLVFGIAVMLGGAGREKLTFNATGARAHTSLLFLAAAGLLIPAVFHKVVPPSVGDAHIMGLSVGVSVVLLVSYGAGLLFSLRTHAHLYNAGEEDALALEAPSADMGRALGILLLSTVGVAVMSELIVHAVKDAVQDMGLTATFVGVVVLATVGNAAEHSTAVTVARKGNIALALSICVESSKQIALFVAPAMVLTGLALGHRMDLEFSPFEVLAVALSVATVHMVAGDGQVNWLEGAMLLSLYVMLGMGFFFVP
jgi:Ca2+:H+ antiporter